MQFQQENYPNIKGKVTHTVINDDGDTHYDSVTGYNKAEIINKAIQKVNNNKKLLTENPELQNFLK